MQKFGRLLSFSALVVLLAIGATACYAGDDAHTPSDLNSSAAQYNGREVLVRGYVVFNASLHALYESEALRREFQNRIGKGDPNFNPRAYAKYCLTIGNPEVMMRVKHGLDGRSVLLKGKFVENYLDGSRIDMGSCPLPTAIMIDEAYLREHDGANYESKGSE